MPVRTAPAGDSSIAAEIARGPGREGTTALPPPPSQAVVAVAVSDPRTPVGVTPTGDSVVTAVIARGPGREGTAASLPAPQAAFAVATPDQTGMESNRPNLDATAIPGAAPNRRRCRACNGTDHVRSYSKRCSANRQQLLRAALDQGAPPMEDPVPVADAGAFVNGRRCLPPMDVVCRHCQAQMWGDEAAAPSAQRYPNFQLCCSKGQVALPPLSPLPQQLADYLDRGHCDHSLFMRHIRTLNGAFAFTSVGATIQQAPGRGPPVYILSGQLHHQIGSLLPRGDGDQPRFAQVYLYDAEQQALIRGESLLSNLTRRQAGARALNSERERLLTICRHLGAMVNSVNPFARRFFYADELLRQASDRGDPIPDVVLRLHAPEPSASSSVRGTYNLPTSNDIAILMPGAGDSHEPTQRDICIYGRSSGLKRISHLHPHYTPLQFPLMFPCGDHGYQTGIPLAQVPSAAAVPAQVGNDQTDGDLHDDQAPDDASEDGTERAEKTAMMIPMVLVVVHVASGAALSRRCSTSDTG